jgi:hypothetical protein
MLFVLPMTIRQADLFTAPQAQRVDEAVDAFRNQGGMLDGKSPAQVGGVDSSEIILALFNVMGEVVDFSVLRFSV